MAEAIPAKRNRIVLTFEGLSFEMKKQIRCILLASCSFFLPFRTSAQNCAGDLIRTLAEDLAEDFRKKTNKADLPEGCKIYVLPFRTGPEGVDTLRTRLGLKLAAAFSQRVGQLVTKGSLDYKPEVLSPAEEGKDLQEIQLRYLKPPSSLTEESAFYKQLSISQKPDFYFTAAYEIDPAFEHIRLTKSILGKDKFNPELARRPDVYLNDQDAEIKEYCRELLKKWNGPLTPPADAYVKLIQFQAQEKKPFAFVDLINFKTGSALKTTQKLTIGDEFQLKIDLKENAFLYAFYYESEDPMHKMYMIGPVDDKANKLFRPGTALLPDDNSVFQPSPPKNRQAIVKVIASKQKIPLSISNSQGYIFLSVEEAQHFVSILEKMKTDEICTTKLLYEIE